VIKRFDALRIRQYGPFTGEFKTTTGIATNKGVYADTKTDVERLILSAVNLRFFTVEVPDDA
jgi:hypothetical protein